jgi:hypothetical protein
MRGVPMDLIRLISGEPTIRRIVITTATAILVLIAAMAATLQVVGAQGAEKEPAAVAEKKDAPEAVPSGESWPRVIEGKTITLIAHQPQLDKWDFNIIEYRMAVEITRQNQKDPFYGGIWFKANTDISVEDRLVRFRDIKVSKVRIEGPKPEEIRQLEKNINDTFLGRTLVVSLDRLIAAAAVTPEAVRIKSIKAEMKPPAILVSQTPAVLLLISGDPALQPVGKTGLSAVINSNLELYYYEKEKTYYLFTGEQWLSASDLKGNWEGNIRPPQVFETIPKDHPKAYLKDLLGTKSGKQVTVLRAAPPAELILIDGEPSLTAISGTSLMFVKNTEQDLFLHRAEGLYYYLTSGRWFRARQLKGPWAAVGDDIPDDFSRIPEDHEKSDALAVVPGTPQAKEAVIEAQIPKKITVKRKEATVNVQYAGKPQFEPVQGTSMAYAVNTMHDVIKLKEQYYCCFQGVWFMSSGPEGPWKVCDAVPKEIYTIPPSHPKHFVTYVSVYGSDAETVTFGYTAGYTGVYVSNGTVVYGTGYSYPTNIYYVDNNPYYYPPPSTYWSWGFGVSFSYGWGYPSYPYYPYYPPYYYGRMEYQEGKYGSGYKYSYGDKSAARYSGSYQGTTFESRQLKGPNEQWGETVIRRGDDWAQTWHRTQGGETVGGIETSGGGKGLAVKGEEGKGGVFKSGTGDLYLGKDGAMYRHDENGWSKYDKGNWNPVEREKGKLLQDRADAAKKPSQLPAGKSDVKPSQLPASKSDMKPSAGTADRSKDISKPAEPRPAQPSTRDAGKDFSSTDTHRELQADRSARSRGDYRAASMPSAASRGGAPMRGGGGRGGGGRR